MFSKPGIMVQTNNGTEVTKMVMCHTGTYGHLGPLMFISFIFFLQVALSQDPLLVLQRGWGALYNKRFSHFILFFFMFLYVFLYVLK